MQMQILKQASEAAHEKALVNLSSSANVYSRFPVHAAAFWEHIFTMARKPEMAKAVLAEMKLIEVEPCMANDRVCKNVSTACILAQRALLH